jgi:putative ABC transport system substrate-binding protein
MGLAESDAEGQTRLKAFRSEFAKLGWKEAGNVQVTYRWAAGDSARTKTLANELIALAPDVILVNTPIGLAALHAGTQKTPIVFVQVVNAVESIQSLAKPGGNITGFANVEYGMTSKWLEILKEIYPTLARVAPLQHLQHPSWPGHVRTITTAAQRFGVEVIPCPVEQPSDIERVISSFASEKNGGLLVLPDTFNTVHRDLVIGAAARYQVPAIYPSRFFAEAGGLMSYGADLADLFGKAAGYIDRILKGANVSELPAQESNKFDFAINLRTVRALGLDIPASVVVRANEFFE